MPNKCKVRVVLRSGRYGRQLHPKMRTSVLSLDALLERDLSALAPRTVRDIRADTLHTPGFAERAAGIPGGLSAAQAAAKGATLLADAHRRVLSIQTEFLVLLARAPTDDRIHEAAPFVFHIEEDEKEAYEEEFNNANEGEEEVDAADHRIHEAGLADGDGYAVPRAYLTPLAYLELLVPYGKKGDGSAQWERVTRRHRQRRT